MRGLRKQETAKFERFFSKIQIEAAKLQAVFFADAGDGQDFETPFMEGENMMGWLIPNHKVSEFEPIWSISKVGDEWSDYYKWAIWSISEDQIQIHFED